MTPKATTVTVAEDSALLRDGVVRLLKAYDFVVLDACGNADDLIRSVRDQKPDLVLTDVRMPPTNTDEGLQAALKLRRTYPDLAVVVLSQYVERSYATELLAGNLSGVGYLLKDQVTDPSSFVETLRRVVGGGSAVDPDVVSQLLRGDKHRRDLERLTPRENQVLANMAQGKSNAAISRDLVISQRAVEKHIGNVLSKLDLPPGGDEHRRVTAVLRYLG